MKCIAYGSIYGLGMGLTVSELNSHRYVSVDIVDGEPLIYETDSLSGYGELCTDLDEVIWNIREVGGNLGALFICGECVAKSPNLIIIESSKP